jgi:hypothetical protein
MKSQAKTIVARLKGEAKRGQKTIYLDLGLYKDFQATCKRVGISSNRAIEEFMRDLIEEHPSKK